MHPFVSQVERLSLCYYESSKSFLWDGDQVKLSRNEQNFYTSQLKHRICFFTARISLTSAVKKIDKMHSWHCWFILLSLKLHVNNNSICRTFSANEQCFSLTINQRTILSAKRTRRIEGGFPPDCYIWKRTLLDTVICGYLLLSTLATLWHS
jgi:hypothetical protein